MNVIYKYPLDETLALQTIELPEGAQILSVVNQREKIVIYALVNPHQETTNWAVAIVGTGQGAFGLDEYDYLGTVLMENGDLVWHVFVQEVSA